MQTMYLLEVGADDVVGVGQPLHMSSRLIKLELPSISSRLTMGIVAY
jgi:hypothetical protein